MQKRSIATIILGSLGVLAGVALAECRFALKAPNGIASSEFR
jgi:hypothetical protein